MSDGSAILRFLNPDSFEESRRLEVRLDGKPVSDLNELEWHRGLILANRWQSDQILVIDEDSGQVLQVLDMSALYPRAVRHKNADVLNGIAYDASDDSWLITGKRWPRIYRVRLELPPRKPR